ncbi:MAG: ABC-F type ribosomal protection protein [Clostridia bacterium]|nr:ABC-F type ribosomal protection protein [Clostridia bacterium]
MNYTIVNGSVEFGAETILAEINFEVKGKDKVAIIGRNGVGKSTLLKSIIDNSILTEGIGEEKFSIYKEGVSIIGYLKQIDFEDESISMIDEILKVYKPVLDTEKKMEILLARMQTDKSEELAKEYSKTLDRYEFLDGYTYKKEYETVINKFGFTKEDKEKKISDFSGGQRTKIAFIKLLLSKPDILLLDEPTNHLDVTTIEWLEGYLKNYPKAVVIVSHDRMFLDKIVNKVYEIEYGTVTKYTGNYSDFERQKKANYEKQLKDYEYQQAEIKRLMRVVERFRYKATKAKMAQSKLKQIEHMVKVKEPSRYDLTSFNINFKLEKESGKDVLHVRNLEIGYSKVIQKMSFDLYRGQKLAVIGENGIGKSTLLKTLVGKLEKLNGNFEFGHNVEIGYFDQQMAFFDSKKTVFDEFSEEFPWLTTTEVRNSLASFMFYGEDVFKTINMLSGGEKVRLQLAKILKKGSNFLILDEPTNHMDIVGKESLEMLLKEYKGTILFVSHDRFFVNKIADSLLVFDKNGVKFYDCTYNEYEEKIKDEDIKEEGIHEQKKKNENNLYLQQKEQAKRDARIKKIEKEITLIENEVKVLEGSLQSEEVYTDYEKLTDIQNQIDESNMKINELMEEWEELSTN